MALNDTRFHAIDNLRALMMWLGIVIHVTMNHVVMPTQVPWRDDQVSPVADAVVGFIHAFRMPVFFIIAGFLAAMLLQRRGARAFLRHRMQRAWTQHIVGIQPIHDLARRIRKAFDQCV